MVCEMVNVLRVSAAIRTGLRRLIPVVSLSTFFLIVILSPLKAIDFEAALGGTQQYSWGHVRFKGASLDIKNDLNHSQVTSPLGRVKVELPLFLPNIYVMAHPLKFEGTGVRSTAFRFGNVVDFAADTNFDSTIKLDHYDAALFYGIPFLETVTAEKLNVEIGFNIRLIDFKAEINQSRTSRLASQSFKLPVPMVYFGLQIAPIESLKFESELRWISFKSSRYYDVIGRIKIKPVPLFFISGGYKFQNILIDHKDVNTDLKFGGPFIEIGLEI